MPGPFGAPELWRRAQGRLPRLQVLFTSGYTDNAIVHDGRFEQGVELLSKPFTQDELARNLRKKNFSRPSSVLMSQGDARNIVERLGKLGNLPLSSTTPCHTFGQ